MFLFLSLLIASAKAEECLNKLPLTEIERYIAAAPAGVVAQHTCKSLPKDHCLCWDGILSWEAAEVVWEDGRPKVINSGPKRDAAEARILAEKEAERAKKASAKAAREELKLIDIDSLTNMAAIRAYLKKLREAQGD